MGNHPHMCTKSQQGFHRQNNFLVIRLYKVHEVITVLTWGYYPNYSILSECFMLLVMTLIVDMRALMKRNAIRMSVYLFILDVKGSNRILNLE